MTESPFTPGGPIAIPSVPNLRDIGGYATADGRRVRTGILYRSVALDKVRPEDAPALDALGVRTVVDLRTAGEREIEPDRLPAAAEAIVADVLADAVDMAPAQMQIAFRTPAVAEQLFGGGRALPMFQDAYRNMISLPSARSAYRTYFSAVGAAERRPLLFHCTTGKDRTGWAAASTLLLLGVSEADVRFDYLLTNRDLMPALQPLFDRFAAAGGDPAVLRPVLGVDERYLDAALEAMTTRFGGIEGYLRDSLGIDDAAQARLREDLTEA